MSLNGTVALAMTGREQRDCRHEAAAAACSSTRSAFAGFRFPPDVIVLAVRWYLRFGLSYRDIEELVTERGIEVDHVAVYRWVVRFAPLLAEAARPAATPSVTAGRSRRPRRWQGGGAMCPARSTS